MDESNSVVSAYTLHRHLQRYCSHPSICQRFLNQNEEGKGNMFSLKTAELTKIRVKLIKEKKQAVLSIRRWFGNCADNCRFCG